MVIIVLCYPHAFASDPFFSLLFLQSYAVHNYPRWYGSPDAIGNPEKYLATFSYSTDGIHWTTVLTDYKMIFDNRRFFMGSKFAFDL